METKIEIKKSQLSWDDINIYNYFIHRTRYLKNIFIYEVRVIRKVKIT